MVTKKDLVISQIQHRETEPIPYVLNIEPEIGIELDNFYSSSEWRGLVDNAIHTIPIPTEDLCLGPIGEELQTDLFGAVWRSNGILRHLETWPLKDPSLSGFHFPAIADCFDSDWEERAYQDIEKHKDKFTLCFFGFGLFERSWTLRGFNNALSDIALNPDFYTELLHQITEHQLAILDRVLKLPVDGILFSDDWGYQKGVLMGPARWRQFFKPNYARLYNQAHAAGKFTFNHCCGGISDIVPDLIEIGLDVYESVQPEANNNNPYELKKRFGDKITFYGCLGAQSMPHYTPEGIRTEIRQLCQEMGRGGGFIIEPAKPIPNGVPVEVAASVVETFLELDRVHIKKTN